MDFALFQRIASEHPLGFVPVYRELFADTLTPSVAFMRLRAGGEPSFLLESVEGGVRVGRYSFLGTHPFRSIEARGSRVTIRDGDRDGARDGDTSRSEEGNFFEIFDREMAKFRSATVAGLPPFTAGAVGYISYDAIRYIEKIPDRHGPEGDLPESLFFFYDTVVAFDHANQRVFLMTGVEAPGRGDAAAGLRATYDRAQARLDDLEDLLSRRLDGEEPRRIRSLERQSIADGMQSNFSREGFEAAVANAKEYIAAGDAFQIVLSQRFQRPVDVDPFQVYRALRALNPAPYLFYLQWDDVAVLGSSPETLVKVQDSVVSVRPIAGTRPRGATEEEDHELEQDLLADEKELAEHRMLVDLGRNDVGRVATFGSVKLPKYLTVERYSHVMHIVSEVQGALRDAFTALDAFQAGFPAGTVSGAPKIRAMEIIDELEPTRRGVYSGAVGYLDFAGNLDTCIAIRTFVFHRGKASVQAGAGIVADSVPAREYMETVHKATALFEALRMAEASATKSSPS